MSFIKPSLASPFPGDLPDGEWAVEKKYDGIRLVVEVGPRTETLQSIQAWSRNEKVRELPAHIQMDLRMHWPPGIYDGELIGVEGSHSYDVSNLLNASSLMFMVFDVLVVEGEDLTSLGLKATYEQRRDVLEKIYTQIEDADDHPVQIPLSDPVETFEQVLAHAAHVWDQGGEGLIVKELNSTYIPGKRLKTWLKVKKELSEVLTVVGFAEGKMGPNSTVILEAENGTRTIVKWKNLEELAMINRDPNSYLGRKLRIAYQELTTDGSYRHPRWDRWEDE